MAGSMISFIKTRISSLPVLNESFYDNLEIVQIRFSPLISCEDLSTFRSDNEGVIVISDLICGYTEINPTHES